LGPLLIKRDIADPMALVLALPVLTDAAQQALWICPVRTKAGNLVDPFVALLPCLVAGDVALKMEHRGQPLG